MSNIIYAHHHQNITDLLELVKDNQVHDKDLYEGLTETEIYQIQQFYLFEENN